MIGKVRSKFITITAVTTLASSCIYATKNKTGIFVYKGIHFVPVSLSIQLQETTGFDSLHR